MKNKIKIIEEPEEYAGETWTSVRLTIGEKEVEVIKCDAWDNNTGYTNTLETNINESDSDKLTEEEKKQVLEYCEKELDW